jgi:hypothetical protein
MFSYEGFCFSKVKQLSQVITHSFNLIPKCATDTLQGFVITVI